MHSPPHTYSVTIKAFNVNALVTELYSDVHRAFEQWIEAGVAIHVYSSGSKTSQQALFKHSTCGDLTPFIGHFFDLSIGLKNDPNSYTNIAREIGLPPNRCLFLTDIAAETRAALSAGMASVVLVRPDSLEKPESLVDIVVASDLLSVAFRAAVSTPSTPSTPMTPLASALARVNMSPAFLPMPVIAHDMAPTSLPTSAFSLAAAQLQLPSQQQPQQQQMHLMSLHQTYPLSDHLPTDDADTHSQMRPTHHTSLSTDFSVESASNTIFAATSFVSQDFHPQS